jgi:CBS domain-containing protein/sporulation protein YlmC with PRC-barrel domain
MTAHANLRTSVSALMGATVLDAGGRTLGHVKEFAVSPTIDAAHVQGILVRLTGSAARWKRPKRSTHGKLTLVPIASIALTAAGAMQLRGDAAPVALLDDDNFLLLERDLLDQQIIDVHGHKVVRVNDVELIWEGGPSTAPELSLRIAEVEVGTRGAVRRLLKGLPITTVERIANRIGARVIPWDFVDLIDRDPARRVKLKIEQERLSQMHPSDLADILEELAPPERQALFRSLDEEVAAEALEEVDPKLQKALLEGLDSESVAGIVEEMDPGAAADLLSELTEERSDAILEEMDPHERQEVEDLLEFADNSAAGQMTTEYLALPHTALVADAIQALSTYEDDIDALTDIYLLEEDGRIHGIIPLVRLLLAAPAAPLSSLPAGHLLCCSVDDSAKKVAEMFDKYNLRSLAVVDDHEQLAGIILAEHVIAQLRAR